MTSLLLASAFNILFHFFFLFSPSITSPSDCLGILFFFFFLFNHQWTKFCVLTEYRFKNKFFVILLLIWLSTVKVVVSVSLCVYQVLVWRTFSVLNSGFGVEKAIIERNGKNFKLWKTIVDYRRWSKKKKKFGRWSLKLQGKNLFSFFLH